MKRFVFKIIAICLAIFVFTPIFEANAVKNYWYVKRNAEHKQPVCDENLSYVEKFGGVYVDREHSDDSQEKVIYLTFDAGYENGNVGKILDVLEKENVKGSFFILSNLIERAPELVKRMAEGGHAVCNHTKNHKNLVGKDEKTVTDEVRGLEDEYRALTGKELARYFRPPEGVFDEELLLRVQNLGYKTVFWSFAYADWDNNHQMAPEIALKKIVDNVHNGEIMLLHPTSETNASIMEKLIVELKSQGFRFATLNEI